MGKSERERNGGTERLTLRPTITVWHLGMDGCIHCYYSYLYYYNNLVCVCIIQMSLFSFSTDEKGSAIEHIYPILNVHSFEYKFSLFLSRSRFVFQFNSMYISIQFRYSLANEWCLVAASPLLLPLLPIQWNKNNREMVEARTWKCDRA